MTLYKVWDEANDEEANVREREGATAEIAAHDYCDNDCDGQSEGYYMGNTDEAAPIICVRDMSTGTLHRFQIYCECSPTFSAYEIQEQKP